MDSPGTVEFTNVGTVNVFDQLMRLNPKKLHRLIACPQKILQLNCKFLSPFFKIVIKYDRKKDDRSPIFKKNNAHVKEKYRPIAFLPSMSKSFERLMEKQVNPYAYTFLNSLACGFSEGHNTQHALLHFFENCKKTLDSRMSTGAIQGIRLLKSRSINC